MTQSEAMPDRPVAGKPRPTALAWLFRGLLVLLVIVVALAVLGAGYQAVASASDLREYPPPGRMVDVGGYELHLYCVGEGSPTVLLEAANQGTVSNWVWIQSELSKTGRVCAYDRPGLGWSDLGPQPQDTVANAKTLHLLLTRAAEPPPYVVVAHSLGGLYARMFAATYPDEVAGMVFVEGTHPNALSAQGLPDRMPNAPDEGMIDAAPFIGQLGVLRMMRFPATDPDLPEPQRSELQAYLSSSKWAALIRRQYHLFPTLLDQVRPLYDPGSLGAIPLAVVLGGRGDGGIEALRSLFAEQAALSENGRNFRIEEANHISLVDREEHALQTSRAILFIVEQARAE